MKINQNADMINVKNIAKSFTLHHQNAAVIDVLQNGNFTVSAGECVALTGASGAGKSTLIQMIYGNYLTQTGSITVGDLDVATAEPRQILRLRRQTLGYVSQFLRVVPRVPTLEIVAEPLLRLGTDAAEAEDRARAMLKFLNLPKRLWSLSPTTFSGGEQQRVNVARGFVHTYPALLLDEPTASLDGKNRERVIELILKAKENGAAIIGIFHDEEARAKVCDRQIDVSGFLSAPAA